MIKIRKVQNEQKDIEEIADIQVNAWKTAYEGIIDSKYLKKMNKEDRIKKIKQRDPIGEFVIAQDEDKVVGFCRYTYDNRYLEEIESVDCEICALYLKPEEKRKGIGKQLFKYIVNEFNNLGKKQMIIWCLKENFPSRKFYEAMGGKYYSEKYIEIGDKKYKEVSYLYDIKEVYNMLNK